MGEKNDIIERAVGSCLLMTLYRSRTLAKRNELDMCSFEEVKPGDVALNSGKKGLTEC